MAHYKLFFILAIFVALFSLGHPQPAGDFQSFCQKTSFSSICFETINSFGTGRLKTDAKGWLQILNSRAITFTLTTITKIGNSLRNNPGTDLKRRLDICNEDFSTANIALDNIDWTLLTRDNYLDYNKRLGQALISVEDCKKVFDDPPPVQSPFAVFTVNTDDAIKLVLEGLNVNQCNKRTACN